MTIYKLVQGDDGPQIKVTLTRDTSGEVIDLTDKTVLLKFRKKNTSSVLTTITSSSAGSDLTNGIAIFVWGSSDLDIAPGNYEAEVEMTDNSSGVVETVYELLEFVVREDF